MRLKDILAKCNSETQEQQEVIVQEDDRQEDMELVYAMIPSLRVQEDEFSEIF